MFKRVEKRLKRKQREDELGLDDKLKDVLGLNDTDSDESDSDADLDDSSVDEDLGIRDEENEDIDTTPSDVEPEEDGDGDDRALITISEALHDPIFIVSLEPDIKECIVCPGKLLKGATMVEKHKASNAHERRFSQFQKLGLSANPKDNAQQLVLKAVGGKLPQQSMPSQTSKRAEKKRIAREKRKIKRQKFKARQMAKKESMVDATTAKLEKKMPGKDQTAAADRKVVEEAKKVRKIEKPIKEAQETVSIKARAELGDTKKSPKRNGPTEPPKKKRKTSTIPTAPLSTPKVSKTTSSATNNPEKLDYQPSSTTKSKSKPKPISEAEESPAAIQELQAQVKSMIDSASSLVKAARARAFADDEDDKPLSSTRKRKSVPTEK